MRGLDRIAVVGRGRLGTAIAPALRAAGYDVEGPLGRGAHAPLGRGDPRKVDAVLLCVPDAEIANAAAAVSPGPLVGHCSGATGLAVLAGHEAFGLHPLMTFPAGASVDLNGVPAAVAGTTPRARDAARDLATALGMRPFDLEDEDRAAYHAAASFASNFLVALEGAAERLAASAGVEREQLVPLARAALDAWGARGAPDALTGPIARGDEATVARQRAAVQERAPDLLPAFDALADLTRALAAEVVA